MEIICDKCFSIDVDAAEFAKQLSVRSCAARGFACSAHLEHRRADRTANRSFNKCQALVSNEHCPSEHADRRAGVETMLDRNCRLRLGQYCRVRRLFERDQISAGLVAAKPVPRLPLR